jgi:hypothetical protein
MPVTLASREAKIGRIEVWNHPGKIVSRTLSQPMAGCGCYHASNSGKCKIGGSRSKKVWAKNKTLDPKPEQKKTGSMVQAIVHLP